MLIPSIDLKDGQVVQLEQGERVVVTSDDVDGWVARFEAFPRVQLIDLDAAMGLGDNHGLIRRICRRLTSRVGGGIRTIARAREALDQGASRIIVGSALFDADGPNLDFARRLADSVGVARVIAAVDSRGGRVVVKGWRDRLTISPVEAARALEPYCGEFLYTHVDTEGLLGGIDMAAVTTLRRSIARPLTAAGGIRSWDEIHRLEAIGVDSVVGMALYTGVLGPEPPARTK